MRQRSVICHTSSHINNVAQSNIPVSRSMSGLNDPTDRSSISPPSPSSNSLPFYSHFYSKSLHPIFNSIQFVLKSSLLHSTSRVTSLLLVTVLFITLTHGTDAKPYASKRLSFGEVRTLVLVSLFYFPFGHFLSLSNCFALTNCPFLTVSLPAPALSCFFSDAMNTLAVQFEGTLCPVGRRETGKIIK